MMERADGSRVGGNIRAIRRNVMGVNQAPTAKGRAAAAGLKQAAEKDEKKTEARKGSDLAKGAKRFEERSKSSDGKSAGDKQRD
jgi:hypothetical protein